MNFSLIIVVIENFLERIRIYSFNFFRLKFFIGNKSSLRRLYIQITFQDNIVYINNVARNIYSLITLSSGFLILIGKAVRADTAGINIKNVNLSESSSFLNDRNTFNNAINFNDVDIYADRHLLFNQEFQISNSNVLDYNSKNNNKNVNNNKSVYIVKKGDTFYRIAKTNGISLNQLIEINKHIKNPDLIYPGNKIYLQNISYSQTISNFQDKFVPRLRPLSLNNNIDTKNINNRNINSNIKENINNNFEFESNKGQENSTKRIVDELKTKENTNIKVEEEDKLQSNQLNNELGTSENFGENFGNNASTNKNENQIKNETYDKTNKDLEVISEEVQVNSEELESKLQKKQNHEQVDSKSLNNKTNFNNNQVNSNLNLNRNSVFSNSLNLGNNLTQNKLPVNLFQRRIYNTLPSINGINNGVNRSSLDVDSQKTTNSQSDSSYLAYLGERDRYLLPLPQVDFEKMFESPNNEFDNKPNDGKSIGYIWPTRGIITSKFNEFRGNGRRHKGIDIANAVGTPIYASASGTVLFSGWNSGGYGNLVILEHENGDQTFYAHNLKNRVFRGQKVLQGQWIADMGSTGYSTGSHLHFEVRTNINGNLSHINPQLFLPKNLGLKPRPMPPARLRLAGRLLSL